MENMIIKQHHIAQEYLICPATSEHFEAMLGIFLETAEMILQRALTVVLLMSSCKEIL